MVAFLETGHHRKLRDAVLLWVCYPAMTKSTLYHAKAVVATFELLRRAMIVAYVAKEAQERAHRAAGGP